MPLWRSPTELQIGIEPGSPRLRNLTRAQERLIQMLYRGMPDAHLAMAAKDLGLEQPDELVSKLSPTLMEVSFPQVDEDFVARNFAEICRAQATYNHSGESVIAARKTHSVFVAEANPCGKLIIAAMENSGIGYAGQDNTKQFDFAVLIGNLTLPPKSYAQWVTSMIPHIAIIFDVDGVLVSPVIEPGKTPCLTCFHEERIEEDSAWPELASQLLFNEQKFDDSTSRLFGAAIANQRTLETIDQLGNFVIQERNRVGYRLNLKSGSVSEFRWDFSTRCLCQ